MMSLLTEHELVRHEQHLRELLDGGQLIGELLSAIYQRAGIDYQLRILEAHPEISAQPETFRSGLLCCS